MPNTSSPYTILIPVLNPALVPGLVEMASAMVPAAGGRVILLAVVEAPSAEAAERGVPLVRAYRQVLSYASESLAAHLEVRPLVRVAADPAAGIVQAVAEEQVDLVLLAWKGFSHDPDVVYSATIDAILRHPPCDVVVAKLGGLQECRRILLPVRGGPYAELALRVSEAIAGRRDANITVLHNAPGSPFGGEPTPAFRAFQRLLADAPRVNRLVIVSGDPQHTIASEVRGHDMLIMGATSDAGSVSPLGPIAERLARETDRSMLIVKTRDSVAAALREVGEHPEPVPVAAPARPLDRLSTESTFHHGEFKDLAKLVEAKRRSGLTISLGLVGFDCAEAVAGVIKAARGPLVESHPLLDQIAFLDLGSSDAAAEAAEALGADVFRVAELLPGEGPATGRGEAYWKGLYALSGDLVVWLPANARAQPRYVYGVLGPMLADDRLHFVGGFDGEATESVADQALRALLGRFFPDLAGYRGPSMKVWAGRRRALEQLPIYMDAYAEMGLLIDVYRRFGLRAIAQVDLEHMNGVAPGPGPEAARLACLATQIFSNRTEEEERAHVIEEVRRQLLPLAVDRRLCARAQQEAPARERPPMQTVPAYRARFPHARLASQRALQRREARAPGATALGRGAPAPG